MRNSLFDTDVDGNTLNLNIEDGERPTINYICYRCNGRYPEKEWDNHVRLCVECTKELEENYFAEYGDI